MSLKQRNEFIRNLKELTEETAKILLKRTTFGLTDEKINELYEKLVLGKKNKEIYRKPEYEECPHKRYNDNWDSDNPNSRFAICKLGKTCMAVFDWKNCMYYKEFLLKTKK